MADKRFCEEAVSSYLNQLWLYGLGNVKTDLIEKPGGMSRAETYVGSVNIDCFIKADPEGKEKKGYEKLWKIPCVKDILIKHLYNPSQKYSGFFIMPYGPDYDQPDGKQISLWV